MADYAKAWADAAKAEQDARDAAERFHSEHVKPIYDAHDAGEATLDEATAQEEAYGRFTSAQHDALTALMTTPAPNWQAVLQKLRMGCDGDWYFDGSDEAFRALQAIRADVERLSGEA